MHHSILTLSIFFRLRRVRDLNANDDNHIFPQEELTTFISKGGSSPIENNRKSDVFPNTLNTADVKYKGKLTQLKTPDQKKKKNINYTKNICNR